MAQGIDKLRRKRSTQRGNITRFSTQINEFDDAIASDEIEHYLNRLQEDFKALTVSDETIHDLMDDTEYEADVIVCEEYIENAKRAIHKANKLIERKNAKDIANRTDQQRTQLSSYTPAPEVKLPTIRLELFTGDIEAWPRFWEQFKSSIDNVPSVSTINKHVFLRGYLDGEPKHLVDGIAITADTYEQTKKILQSRYGDKNRIIQSHLDFLEHLKPAHCDSPEILNAMYIDCHRRIQALTALGEDVDVYGRMLAPKILRAFPDELCRRWLIHAKRSSIEESNISRLMEFLNEEVESALTTQKIRGDSHLTATYVPTAATLHVNTRHSKSRPTNKQAPDPYCVFCENRGHWAQNCQRTTNNRERIEKLRTSNRCFLCLNRGHNVRQCTKQGKASCIKCKKQHHVSICSGENQQSTSVGKIEVNTPNFTYLQTARMWITGPTGRNKLTRCILDAGSQSSFINSSLVDLLQLKVTDSRNLLVTSFESSSSASSSRRQVSFEAREFSTNTILTITAFESNNTYSSHPTVPQDISVLISTGKMKLADPKDESPELPIEILIGADHYWKIVKMEQPIRVAPSLVLLPSLLGWILSGDRSGTTVNQVMVHHISLSNSKTTDETIQVSDETVRQFWELETIGIKEQQDRSLTSKDSTILQEFHDSYQTKDGRRVVSLPKRKDMLFSDNLSTAERRFSTLEKRLQTNEEFRVMYHQQMMDYISKEQVEIVPDDDACEVVFYFPHHAVKKEKRDGTKYRIVFDASSHDKGSPSLNDVLEMGPNLLPEIVATLLRFRTFPKAIVCDGSQAFLQLALHENDRNLTRFLWYRLERNEEGNYETTSDIVPYRFARLPFGLTSSPFLLSATLREVAALYYENYPNAAAVLDKSTFMDDFTASGEDDNHVITLYYELTALLKRIKLPLSKWATSSEPLQEIWKSEGQEVKSETRVLGVDWNTVEDYIFTDQQSIKEILSGGPGTKRNVLSATAKFYDPLGLFAPVVIIAKILFQDTWLRGIEWEEILPSDLAHKWQSWMSKLQSLPDVHIPRWIGISNKQSESEIHVFCDASERAYGAVLYIRSTLKTACLIRLACSKVRLAPIKRVTLPRLELLAALIGSRLLHYFCKATDSDITKAILWSDSTVTLGWIRNDPNKWKTFVCNRVTEILSYTTPSQWKHCPGTQNPADHLSRGIQADELCSLDCWWNGPLWLAQERSSWPPDISSSDATLTEAKRVPSQVLTVTTLEPLLNVARFSSYWRLLHVTAWILRFVEATRRKRRFPPALTADELETARNYWIRKVQEQCFTADLAALRRETPLLTSSPIARFNPFLQDGIIRLGGRLQFAALSMAERHPILLDGTHHFTQLLIIQTHIRLHHLGVRIVLTELRSEFWILRARQTIKKALHTCLPCKIAHNRRFEEVEAPLPLDRVRPIRPFAVTGIDFAGPLYVKIGNKLNKSYIVLFTCATVRAIHLELATDMTTDRFLMAMQRFVGRRGLPQTVYSDNAPTFYAANKELAELQKIMQHPKLQHYFAHHNIVWKFIAPRAAWWGGWWERMIGSTKRCLRKVLGRSQEDEEGLNTILISIEASLNSRPITQDTDGDDVLTPAHFLNCEKLTTIPHGPEPTIKRDLTREFRHKQKMTEDFWQRWKREYLLQLRNYHQVKGLAGRQQHKPRVGDVVLLQEDVRPRHMWKRARIEEVRHGRDDKIRGVILRQPDGTKISRPIQLVIPLEIDQGGEDVTDI